MHQVLATPLLEGHFQATEDVICCIYRTWQRMGLSLGRDGKWNAIHGSVASER
jgi:hypothetical protein